MDPRWLVDADDAFRRWTFNDRPTATEKVAMVRWLEWREQAGPPRITGYAASGLPECRGFNGETIEYDAIEFPPELAPPYGIIAIKEITGGH